MFKYSLVTTECRVLVERFYVEIKNLNLFFTTKHKT